MHTHLLHADCRALSCAFTSDPGRGCTCHPLLEMRLGGCPRPASSSQWIKDQVAGPQSTLSPAFSDPYRDTGLSPLIFLKLRP